MNKVSSIAFAIALGLVLDGCSQQKTPAEVIESAASLLEQRQVNEAIIELKNAIRISPTNSQLRLVLAEAYIERGEYLPAEKEILKAIDLGDELNGLTNLALIKMKLGKQEELSAISQQVINNDEIYQQVLTYLAVSYFNNNDLSKAEDLFSQAKEILEGEFSQLSQSYLHLINKNYQASRDGSYQLYKDSPKFYESLLLIARIEYAMGNFNLAAKHYQDYASVRPGEIFIRYYEVKSLIRDRQYQEAEKRVKELMSRHKDSPIVLQTNAYLKFINQDYRQAKQLAEQALFKEKNLPQSTLIVGLSAYQLGEYEQAFSNLSKIVKQVPLESPIRRFYADTQIKLGYHDKLIASSPELASISDEDVMLVLTALEQSSDNDVERLRIERAIDSFEVEDQRSVSNLAILQLSSSEPSKGIALLKNAADASSTFDKPKQDYISSLLALNEYSLAEREIINWQSKGINNAQLERWLLLIYSQINQPEKSKMIIDKLLSLDEFDIAANFHQFKLGERTKNEVLKQQAIDKLIVANPKDLGILSWLAKKTLGTGNYDKVAGNIKTYAQLEPKNLNWSILYYKTLYASRQLESLIAELSEPETFHRLKQQIDYWLLLGNSYQYLGNNKDSIDVFRNWFALDTENRLAAYRLADAYQQEKLWQNSLDVIDSEYRGEDKEAFSMLALEAYIAMDRLTDFFDLISTLSIEERNTRPVMLLEGRAHYASENYEDALNLLSPAYQMKPDSLTSALMVESLAKIGKEDEAIRFLEKRLNIEPEERRSLWQLSQLTQDTAPNKAINSLLKLKQMSNPSPVLMNNLAMAYLRNGQIDLAKDEIVKAVNLASKNRFIINSAIEIAQADNDIEMERRYKDILDEARN